jgi:parallel beta-helix repeat protein
MDNLVIDDAVFPIYAQYGSVTLRNSRITATGTCDYIGVRSGEALIENNLFFGNKYPDTDGIDLDGDEGAIVRGNKFYNFHGLNCDAIDIGEQSSNILIKGNFIYNSSDKGISVGQHSTVNIEKNVIVSCNQGVAVKDESYVTINGNTLFMNNYAVACYEKNFGQGGGHAEVINSIFSASLYSSYLVDNLSSISVSNSLSDMDILPGSNNLFGDPMFIDLVHHNLQLNENSVCIDAGIENGEPDPDGTPNDIGAYYIFDEKDIPGTERESVISQVVINEIMYNSSTDQNNNDWIELYNNGNNNIDLSGWKLSDSDSLHIFEFPINTILNSRSFVVVCRNSDEFKNAYPGVGEVIGNFEFGLGEIDKVILRNTNDSLISFVAYSNVFPWADAGSISNHSLELNNPFSVNYRTVDWALSEDGGSPGRHNSKYDPTHGGDAEIPTEFSLYQNYPNPFNPSTRINYNVSQTTRIKISVYNVLGEEVENLVNEFKQPGFYTLTFSGNQLASAVYIVRMEAGKYIHSIKMVLLK